jgi:hypothetical protein
VTSVILRVLNHFLLSRAIHLKMTEHGRRGCLVICTEAQSHAAAHMGGTWVSARARGHVGWSHIGCGHACAPGLVGPWLAGPCDGPTSPSPRPTGPTNRPTKPPSHLHAVPCAPRAHMTRVRAIEPCPHAPTCAIEPHPRVSWAPLPEPPPARGLRILQNG